MHPIPDDMKDTIDLILVRIPRNVPFEINWIAKDDSPFCDDYRPVVSVWDERTSFNTKVTVTDVVWEIFHELARADQPDAWPERVQHHVLFEWDEIACLLLEAWDAYQQERRAEEERREQQAEIDAEGAWLRAAEAGTPDTWREEEAARWRKAGAV